MGLLKLRKNKKFSYEPRFYKGEGNPFEIKHKFDEHRTTIGNNSGLKAKLNNVKKDFQNPDKEANRRVLIIAGILFLIFLIIIGFDLSIFFS